MSLPYLHGDIYRSSYLLICRNVQSRIGTSSPASGCWGGGLPSLHFVGMVQANVGQKLVNVTVYEFLPCLETEICMPLLGDMTESRDWLLCHFLLTYPSPASIQWRGWSPSGQFDICDAYVALTLSHRCVPSPNRLTIIALECPISLYHHPMCT